MLLYSDHGAVDYELGGSAGLSVEWEVMKDNAVRILRKRGQHGAAGLLESLPFDLCDAWNNWGDSFRVLVATLPRDQFIEIGAKASTAATRKQAESIARILSEMDDHVRHVVIEQSGEGMYQAVSMPALKSATEEVKAALRDAEVLLAKNGPERAVDRVHTAMHAYMKVLCAEASLDFAANESFTGLYKLLYSKHPRLSQAADADSIRRILRSMSAAVDTMNTLRNNRSPAHPSGSLDSSEAMLVVDLVRSILRYLSAKLVV